MAFEIVLLPRAKAEITSAISWYESRQKGLGEDYLTEVEREIRRIGENPLLFPQSGGSESPFRKAVLKKFPFLILFRVFNKQVIVHSVINTHLDPNKKPSA